MLQRLALVSLGLQLRQSSPGAKPLQPLQMDQTRYKEYRTLAERTTSTIYKVPPHLVKPADVSVYKPRPKDASKSPQHGSNKIHAHGTSRSHPLHPPVQKNGPSGFGDAQDAKERRAMDVQPTNRRNPCKIARYQQEPLRHQQLAARTTQTRTSIRSAAQTVATNEHPDPNLNQIGSSDGLNGKQYYVLSIVLVWNCHVSFVSSLCVACCVCCVSTIQPIHF